MIPPVENWDGSMDQTLGCGRRRYGERGKEGDSSPVADSPASNLFLILILSMRGGGGGWERSR